MPERERGAVDPDRLKEVGESAVNSVLERVGRGIARVQENSPLAYDLLESDDAFLVVFDAPGAERSDVQVRFNDGAVEVRIDRFRDFHEGFEMRFPGRGLALDGRVELPRTADVEPSEASSTLTERGTLRVRVPKRRGSAVAVDEEPAEPAGVDADRGPAETDGPVDLDADASSTPNEPDADAEPAVSENENAVDPVDGADTDDDEAADDDTDSSALDADDDEK